MSQTLWESYCLGKQQAYAPAGLCGVRRWQEMYVMWAVAENKRKQEMSTV